MAQCALTELISGQSSLAKRMTRTRWVFRCNLAVAFLKTQNLIYQS